MNKVIYVKVNTPKKIESKIETLDIIQVIADQGADGIKGFYVFYRDENEKSTQLQLEIEEEKHQHEIIYKQENEVIKTQEEMFEDIRKRDEERVKEYDKQTARTRELEREMWQKRMQRIQSNASHKKED